MNENFGAIAKYRIKQDIKVMWEFILTFNIFAIIGCIFTIVAEYKRDCPIEASYFCALLLINAGIFALILSKIVEKRS